MKAGRAVIDRAAVAEGSTMAEPTATHGDRRDLAGFRLHLIERRNRHRVRGGCSRESEESRRDGEGRCKQNGAHVSSLSLRSSNEHTTCPLFILVTCPA